MLSPSILPTKSFELRERFFKRKFASQVTNSICRVILIRVSQARGSMQKGISPCLQVLETGLTENGALPGYRIVIVEWCPVKDELTTLFNFSEQRGYAFTKDLQ